MRANISLVVECVKTHCHLPLALVHVQCHGKMTQDMSFRVNSTLLPANDRSVAEELCPVSPLPGSELPVAASRGRERHSKLGLIHRELSLGRSLPNSGQDAQPLRLLHPDIRNGTWFYIAGSV